MPIGSGIVYNTGDLILNQVSSSGAAFLETKIAAATSSLIYFDSTARINSASLNSITVGTASYVSGSNSIVTNFTASNISASGTSSFGYVGIGTTSAVQDRLTVYNSSAATDYTASTFSGGTGYFDNKGGISIYNPNTTTNNFSALDFYIDQTNYSNVGAARIICKTGARSTGGTFDTSLIFLTHNQAGTWNQTVIDNSGNVGIGTTSPSAKLTIVDNTNGGTINLVGRTSDDTAAINFRVTGDGSTYAYVAPDTNEFRLYHNDGFMSFYPGGSEKVRITSTGNVGIGTTIPSVRLHVSGSSILANNISIDPDAYSNTIIAGAISDRVGWGLSSAIGGNAGTGHSWAVGTNGGYLYMGYGNGSSNDSLQEFLMVSGSRNLYLVPVSGNIGVGTFSVYQKLTINGAIETGANGSTTGGPSFYIKYDGASGNYINSIGTEYSSGNTILGYGITGKSSSAGYVSTFANFSGHRGMLMIGAGTLEFKNSRTSLATAVGSDVPMTSSFYIDNSGNVGIGTTTPSAKLNIASTSQTTKAIIQSVSAATGLGGYLAFNPGGDSTYSKVAIGVYDNYYSSYNRGNIAFMINSAADATEVGFTDTKMYISASGDVGIGTTAPTTQANYRFLQVNGTNSAVIETMVGGTRIGGFDSSATALYVGSIGSYPVVFRTAVDEKMRITAAGSVGIGTSSPAQKLEIQSGSILIRGDGNALFGTYYASAGENTFFTLHSGSGNTFHMGNDVSGTNYNTMVFTAATDSTGGKVGIGTSSPGSKLQINDNTPTLTIRANDGGTSRKAYIDFYTTFYNYPSDVGARRTSTIVTGFADGTYGTWGTEFLSFNVGSGSANDSALLPIERMRIDGSGNLGIGTTSPVNKLQIAGNVSGSSFTSSISNAVGFLGTSSWAQNVVSSSYATTAQTANALNTGNSYTIAGLTNNGTLSQQGTLSMGSGYQILATTGTAPIPGIAFVGDTNTGIYSPSADTIGFSINGSERARIDSNGNVGIGTTTPNSKLEVAGNASSPPIISVYHTTQGRSGSLGIDTNGVYIQNSNNGDYFDLKNASGASRFRVIYDNATHLTTNFTSIGNLSATGSKLSVFGNLSVGSTYGSTAAPSNGAIFQGSVGIGTTSPDSAFHVYSTSFEPAIRITSTSGSVKTYGLIVSPYWATGSFHVYDYTTDNSRLQISTTGNVGIGIGAAAPANKLDLVGDLRIRSAGAAIILDTAATSDGRMEYKYNGTRKALIGVDSNNLQISADSGNYLQFITNGSQRMIITNGGGVGIGTSNPNYAFDVYTNGSADALMSIRASGSANARIYFDAANGDLTGGDYCHLGQNKTTLDFVINTGGSAGNIHLQPKEGTSNGILYVSGSSRFGLVSSQSHQFTGSVNISGSLNATSSWATTAVSANALNASNTYTVAGLTSAYVDVNGSGTIPSTGIYRPSSKTLGLSADATLILKINGSVSPYVTSIESGNVGIGSSNPTSKLEVLTSAVSLANQPNIIGNFRGDTDGRSLIRVDNTSTSAGAAALQAGISFVAYSNVSNQPSANKHEAQIILGSTGATSVTGGQTGTLQIVAPQDIAFNVSASNTIMTGSNYTVFGSNAMYITRLGSVGIGTTVPSARLHVTGSTGGIFEVDTAGGATTFYVSASGNVGIGTTNATDKLTLYGELASYKTGADTIQTQVYLANTGNTRAFNLQLNSGGTGLDLWSYNSSNAWLRHTTFNYDGNVGIGTAAPAAKLEISGSSNSALLNIKSPISGAILYVSGSGAVGIGDSNVGTYRLYVSGSFGATTKSFIIDHPTKAGKKLIYGSLESPYHGIRLTGRDTLVNGKCKVELPEYIYKLILHDSVNIQLTGIKCNKTLYVDEINIPENYFTIAYDKAIFESYKDYDFFWDFTAIRADVPELITEL